MKEMFERNFVQMFKTQSETVGAKEIGLRRMSTIVRGRTTDKFSGTVEDTYKYLENLNELYRK